MKPQSSTPGCPIWVPPWVQNTKKNGNVLPASRNTFSSEFIAEQNYKSHKRDDSAPNKESSEGTFPISTPSPPNSTYTLPQLSSVALSRTPTTGSHRFFMDDAFDLVTPEGFVTAFQRRDRKTLHCQIAIDHISPHFLGWREDCREFLTFNFRSSLAQLGLNSTLVNLSFKRVSGVRHLRVTHTRYHHPRYPNTRLHRFQYEAGENLCGLSITSCTKKKVYSSIMWTNDPSW